MMKMNMSMSCDVKIIPYKVGGIDSAKEKLSDYSENSALIIENQGKLATNDTLLVVYEVKDLRVDSGSELLGEILVLKGKTLIRSITKNTGQEIPISIGRHKIEWNLKDDKGKVVEEGEYIVKVRISVRPMRNVGKFTSLCDDSIKVVVDNCDKRIKQLDAIIETYESKKAGWTRNTVLIYMTLLKDVSEDCICEKVSNSLVNFISPYEDPSFILCVNRHLSPLILSELQNKKSEMWKAILRGYSFDVGFITEPGQILDGIVVGLTMRSVNQ